MSLLLYRCLTRRVFFAFAKMIFFFFGRLWPCALLWTCVQGHRQRAALSQRMNIQSNEQKSSEQTKKKNNNNTVETNSQIRKNDAQQIAKTQQQHNCVIDLVVEVLAICTKIYSVCHSNWPKTRWPVTWETAPNIKWNRENKEMCEHQLCKHWWAHDRFDEEAKKSGLLNENSKKKNTEKVDGSICVLLDFIVFVVYVVMVAVKAVVLFFGHESMSTRYAS